MAPETIENVENAEKTPDVDLYVDIGDLDALKRRGQVRILAWRSSDSDYLPRAGSAPDIIETYAVKFVRSLNLEPVLIPVDDFGRLIPMLTEGKGDFIAATMTITDARRKQVSFTVPVATTLEQLVGRAGEPAIANASQLSERIIAVPPDTTFMDTVEALRQKNPRIRIRPISGAIATDEALDLLASKRLDLTVLDSVDLETALQYRDDVRAVMNLTGERPLAWAVRPCATQLLESLNQFIALEAVAYRHESVYREDLPGLQARKTLRVLTQNNAAMYFLWKGELVGYEYEMARAFAQQLGLRLEMIVAPSQEDLIPMLLAGKGDLIAAFMSITPERKAMPGLAFSRPYNYVSELVAARADDRISGVAGLAGRTLVARKGSSYWQTLQGLAHKGISFKMNPAPADMETEEILARVARGGYDLTVADSHILALEMAFVPNLKAAFAISNNIPQGWAVRSDCPKLLAAIDTFWNKEYRGVFANMTFNKYFKGKPASQEAAKKAVAQYNAGHISPYDSLAQYFGGRYAFDWRLVLSQTYQESRFDPKARSASGARGLLQVMPKTAAEVGIADLTNPAGGLHAGVRYLRSIWNRFEGDLNVRDRTWFALASYNAGLGHVQDARRLAAQKGWDQNRWFDSVEKAMLLLSQPAYAHRARYGYVRGTEPVNYVRNIYNRYRSYQEFTNRPSLETGANKPKP